MEIMCLSVTRLVNGDPGNSGPEAGETNVGAGAGEVGLERQADISGEYTGNPELTGGTM